jgi:Tetratricopeptide repeat
MQRRTMFRRNSRRRDLVPRRSSVPAAELAGLRYRYLSNRLGAHHPETLEAVLEVARILAAAPGGRTEAVETYLALVRHLWATAGPDDTWYLEILQEAGEVVYQTGQVARAESMFQQVLEARRRVLGPHHPDTQVTARTLSRVRPATG